MSGRIPSMRGNRSGRNRAGRGPLKSKNQDNRSSSRKNYEIPTKNLNDYIYYIGTSKQANDYQATTKFLINHIRKTYLYGEDIGNALESKGSLEFNVKIMNFLFINQNLKNC